MIENTNINTKKRSGAKVARWTHNPKAVGSNPTSATSTHFVCGFFHS